MFRVAAFLSLVALLLAALALISCLSIEDRRQIRGMPRSAWVIVILLVPLVGAIAWFGYGRPRPAGGARFGWRQPTSRPEPPQRRAPDDDPDFLRTLDTDTVSKDDEDLLRRWEEDLRRREDEQRHRDPGTEP